MSGKEPSLAAEAYLYGYPLVYCVQEIVNAAGTAAKMSTAAPVNTFGYARELLGPETEFVSPNNDTLYTMAAVDVTEEAQVLHLPDTHDRYYVMQFVDTWSNNFAYLGRRATGTQEGYYLLTGPVWDGEVPDSVTLLRAPTNVFMIIGRYATTGGNDLAKVWALQDDTWLTPLSRYPKRPDNSQRTLGDRIFAPYDHRVGEDLIFWEQFRAWMKLFPPSEIDQAYQEKFEPLGLMAAESPYANPDPALVQTLRAGQTEFRALLEASLAVGEPVNGWNFSVDAFNFNLDHLGIGTLDTPKWKLADRETAFFYRAVTARVGLWGNHSYEAAYPQVFLDENGEQLNGARKYVLHFDELPPVDAFWSVTMYNMPEFYLVANPIDRYSIGDRTPGLKFDPDGSLDIYIQHESPEPDKESNWLPAPEGDFRPILRMYQPRPEALDGTFILPPIHRME
jgi:hypothetical protein